MSSNIYGIQGQALPAACLQPAHMTQHSHLHFSSAYFANNCILPASLLTLPMLLRLCCYHKCMHRLSYDWPKFVSWFLYISIELCSEMLSRRPCGSCMTLCSWLGLYARTMMRIQDGIWRQCQNRGMSCKGTGYSITLISIASGFQISLCGLHPGISDPCCQEHVNRAKALTEQRKDSQPRLCQASADACKPSLTEHLSMREEI